MAAQSAIRVGHKKHEIGDYPIAKGVGANFSFLDIFDETFAAVSRCCL